MPRAPLFVLIALLCIPTVCSAEPFVASGSNEVLLIPTGVKPPCTGAIKDGVDRQYYSDGKLYDETSCRGGQIHGLSRQYTKDGKLWSERNFKIGKLDGASHQYDKSGKLVLTVNYADGIALEPVVYYSPTWQLTPSSKPVILLEKAPNFVDEDKKTIEFMKSEAFKNMKSSSGTLKKRDLTVERR